MKLGVLSIVGLLTAFSLVTSVIAETVNPESIVSCRPTRRPDRKPPNPDQPTT
jgi:hypothetical protein